MRTSTCQGALFVATLVVLGTAIPLRASETNDHVESSFQKSRIYSKDDAIKTGAQDDVVTLNGEDASEAQKELTAEYVTDEKKEIIVVKTLEMPEQTKSQKIDDASMSAQVKTAPPSHRPAAPTGLRLMSSP